MKPSSSMFPVSILLFSILQGTTPFVTKRRTGNDSHSQTQRFSILEKQSPTQRTPPLAAETTTTHAEKKQLSKESTELLPSIIKPGIKTDTSVWKNVCPGIFEETLGADVRLHWNKREASVPISQLADGVALSLLTEIMGQTVHSLPETKQMQASLATSLETFMTFCEDYFKPESFEGYTARIVSTRGSSSTKCPAWHQDHVPVRWIQSLFGPGVEWVDLEEWAASEDSDRWSVATETVDELNQRRVDPDLPIRQASPGEAVLLAGRSWSQHCRQDKTQNMPAVVHKSPSGFLPWQGRVLLTVDILTKDE